VGFTVSFIYVQQCYANSYQFMALLAEKRKRRHMSIAYVSANKVSGDHRISTGDKHYQYKSNNIESHNMQN